MSLQPSRQHLHRQPFQGRIRQKRRANPEREALILQVHAECLKRPGQSKAVARERGLHYANLIQAFLRRGLELPLVDPKGGQFQAAPPLTEAEIQAAIESSTKFWVPPALRNEWRDWSYARRVEIIERLRVHLGVPRRRPPGPVIGAIPFEYGHEEAHALADKLNAGRDSRTKAVQIRINSEGVIWREQLWFWVEGNGYVRGPYDAATGRRRTIHKILWEEANGPTPPGHVIRTKDGNPNHLSADNLVLRSRDAVARENQQTYLTRRSRALTTALLSHHQPRNNEPDHTHAHISPITLRTRNPKNLRS